MEQQNVVATNFENSRKHLLLVMLLTAAAVICVFIASIARAAESQPIIVADLFGDLQRTLEKSARDVVNNSGGTRREEQPAANQPAPSSQYPEQTVPTTTQTKKEKKQAKGVGASQVSSLPFVEWLGTWRSQDGKKSLVVSSSKVVNTFLVKGDDGKSRKVTAEHRWSNVKKEEDVREEDTFGLLKKRTTLAEISRQFEMALKQYKQDPTDFNVSEPTTSRKAILAMSPGVYQVMWRYSGGDCGYSEYIVDKDRMLEVSVCKYGHNIAQYTRAK